MEIFGVKSDSIVLDEVHGRFVSLGGATHFYER
jgi:hypothetical protein